MLFFINKIRYNKMVHVRGGIMKKIMRLIARILITITSFFIILFIIDKVLELKHRDKFVEVDTSEWTCESEQRVLYHFLDDKYRRTNDEKTNFLIQPINLNVPEKNKNEKRILVIGDSFIFGVGNTNVNYTWWKQLNLRIKEAGYSDVNVYAAGYYGYNTKQQLEKILNNEKLIKNINPDLIIMGYVPNDPDIYDENGNVVIKAEGDLIPEENKIYKENPILYYEFIDRLWALGEDEYDKLLEIGETLGAYRWDARLLYLVQDERLEDYKKILVDVDKKLNEYNIPYFYAFTNNFDNALVERANEVVYNELKKMSIDAYYEEYDSSRLLKMINSEDDTKLTVNSCDNHPGIVWTYDYSRNIFDILKKNYSFIFENQKIKDISKYVININDTMPLLNVTKVKNNVFEFEYPAQEKKRTVDSKFLYYPIEKEYVKLNLEYPKDIKKIIVTGSSLNDVEVYVNTIDSEYGFDINEVFQRVTSCKKVNSNTYEVNKKITSVNIHAVFKNDKDRKIKIEFIE